VQPACFRIASAKVLSFSETTKYFPNFFQKKDDYTKKVEQAKLAQLE
jgi:hypothetical protein